MPSPIEGGSGNVEFLIAAVQVMSEIVTITGLGAEGDGAATTAAGAQIFIPQALPGETWRYRRGLCGGTPGIAARSAPAA